MKLRYKILNTLLLLLVLIVGTFAVVISYELPCEPDTSQAPTGDTMQAIVARCYGSAEVLELATVARPKPTGDELLVRVKSASVNPLDYHLMRGSPYVLRMAAGIGKPKDIQVGRDFAGVVEAVGPGARKFQVGDRVYGSGPGAFAEYLLKSESRGITKIPENVTFAQAAAVPIAGLTALQALRDKGELKSGQRVLINGASGGVGTYAVQIAKAMDAHVSGVCSTRNVELVQSAGADQVFDYKKENFTESGQQFDLILDMVGNHSFGDLRKVMTPNGRLILVGGDKGNWIAPFVAPLKAMAVDPFVDQTIITLFAVIDKQDLETVANMMAEGKVTSVIDRHYPLAEVPAAITYSESGRARGKIIVGVP